MSKPSLKSQPTRRIGRIAAACVGLLVTAFAVQQVAYSHCEIPCGIYGDKTRVTLLLEHCNTIEKSMSEIDRLSKSDHTSLDINQLARWVQNKEEHANKVQHIVTQYFMTQRVKPKAAADGEAHEKYLTQVTSLHQMLVQAMKCKQTVDPANVTKLRSLCEKFCTAYFNEEDLKHLRDHHEG